MAIKLTLSIDSDVISAAKQYAQENRRSLSNIVENYLKSLTVDNPKEAVTKPTPIVNKIKGSIKVPKNFDFEKALEEAKIEKYGKGLFG